MSKVRSALALVFVGGFGLGMTGCGGGGFSAGQYDILEVAYATTTVSAGCKDWGKTLPFDAAKDFDSTAELEMYGGPDQEVYLVAPSLTAGGSSSTLPGKATGSTYKFSGEEITIQKPTSTLVETFHNKIDISFHLDGSMVSGGTFALEQSCDGCKKPDNSALEPCTLSTKFLGSKLDNVELRKNF